MRWRNELAKLLLLAAALLPGGCAAAGDHCALSLAADMAVSMRDRLFYTDLGFDHGSARLIVDTGSDNDILRDSATRRLGLRRQMQEDVVEQGIGGRRRTDLATFSFKGHDGTPGGDVEFMSNADEALPDWSDGLLGMQMMGAMDDDLRSLRKV